MTQPTPDLIPPRGLRARLFVAIDNAVEAPIGAINEAVAVVLAEVRAATAEAGVTHSPAGGDMYAKAYHDVQKILNGFLGTGWADGAGEGIAADVALLGKQRDEARTEVAELRRGLLRVEMDREALAGERDAYRAEVMSLRVERDMLQVALDDWTAWAKRNRKPTDPGHVAAARATEEAGG